MKKAILIATPVDYDEELRQHSYTMPPMPPIGVLALGSFLHTHQVPLEIIDVQMDYGVGLSPAGHRAVAERIASDLAEQAEEIAWVGISLLASTSNSQVLGEALRQALPQTPILLGGYFPSRCAETLLRQHSWVTAIVCGDGENPALEICQRIARGESFLNETTPGLAWRDGKSIRINPISPADVNALPILNFSLLRHPDRYDHIGLMTSRGCPFGCEYCLEKTMRPYVPYPTRWVRQQIEHVERQVPNTHIFVIDPIFGMGKSHCAEVCSILAGRRFSYMIESRADVLSEESVRMLKQANVDTIYLGIESASPSTLKRMNKVRSESQAQSYLENAVRILETCFTENVTVVVGIMLNYPGDSPADYEATLAFIRQIEARYQAVSADGGCEAGYMIFPETTVVYDGSPLAGTIPTRFAQTVLEKTDAPGEYRVVHASEQATLSLAQDYSREISQHDCPTPLAFERVQNYILLPMQELLDTRPDLHSSDDVWNFGDLLKQTRLSV